MFSSLTSDHHHHRGPPYNSSNRPSSTSMAPMDPVTAFKSALASMQLFVDDTVDILPLQLPIVLRNSNAEPSQAELTQLLAYQETAPNKIEKLETIFSALESAFQCASQAVRGMKESLKVAERIAHPMRRFPDDLLLEIFTTCVSDAGCGRMSPSSPPWILTHVCRRWRQLAVNKASLCRQLDLCWNLRDTGYHDRSSVKRLAFEEMLLLQVTRCRLSPTHITLQRQFSDKDPMLSILLSTSPSWKSLVLSIDSQSSSAFRRLSGALPNLETLRLSVQGRGANHSTSWRDIKIAFHHLPKLRTLMSETLNDLAQYDFPQLSSVQHYRSTYRSDPNISQVLDSLKSMQGLQTFSLHVDNLHLDDDNDNGAAPTEHMSLQVFSFSTRATGELSTLLSSLRFPNLVELNLGTPVIYKREVGILECHIRSLQRLRLAFEGRKWKGGNFTEIFKNAHQLQELTLQCNQAMIITLLQALVLPRSSILPSLQKLTLGLAFSSASASRSNVGLPVSAETIWNSGPYAKLSVARPEIAVTILDDPLDIDFSEEVIDLFQ